MSAKVVYVAPRSATNQIVEVFHSGGDGKPQAPFLFRPAGKTEDLPLHPNQAGKRTWTLWKLIRLNAIAVQPTIAAERIHAAGYYIQ
jgi:hypothetical protein